MSYRTTFEADQDIISLYARSIADFGRAQTEHYVDGLFATFDLIGENPSMARERVEFDPPTRLHPYGAHIIAYVTDQDGVLIVRVLHGRQDWQKLLS